MPAELASTDLTGPQLQALHALLAGVGPREISRSCGVSERTLRTWKNLPAFRAQLGLGQASLLEETCLQLTLAAATAVQTLVDVCEDSGASPSVRVAAAGKLLTFLFRNVPAMLPPVAVEPVDSAPRVQRADRTGARQELFLQCLAGSAALDPGTPPPPAASPSLASPSIPASPLADRLVEPLAASSAPAVPAETPPAAPESLPDGERTLPAFTLPLDSRAAASELARLLRAETCDIETFRIGRPQREVVASGR